MRSSLLRFNADTHDVVTVEKGSWAEENAVALTDEEFRTLAKLLSRYAAEELDQWEHWRFSTIHGDVFVDIHRLTTLDRESYDDLSRWLD